MLGVEKMEVPERCTTLQNVSGCIIMQLSGDKCGTHRKFGLSGLWTYSVFAIVEAGVP